MKKFLLPALLFFSYTANAQTVLFEDGFETYEDFTISNVGNWMLHDGDGRSTYIGGITVAQGVLPWANAYAPMAYQIFNPSVAGVQNGHDGENSNFNPHSGQKYAAAWASSPSQSSNANNDWLISPAINLGESGNQLSFWVKSLADDYGLEKYNVLIYVGSAQPTNTNQFTPISGSSAKTAPIAWTKDTYNLDAYSNQTIRFAIQYVSSDVYMLMVDDALVTTGSLGTNDAQVSKATMIYPNPSTGVFNIQSSKKINDVNIITSDGRTINTLKASDKVDLTSKPKGTYILKLNFADGSSSTEKVIKK